jgi:hypothetical protein
MVTIDSSGIVSLVVWSCNYPGTEFDFPDHQQPLIARRPVAVKKDVGASIVNDVPRNLTPTLFLVDVETRFAQPIELQPLLILYRVRAARKCQLQHLLRRPHRFVDIASFGVSCRERIRKIPPFCLLRLARPVT